MSSIDYIGDDSARTSANVKTKRVYYIGTTALVRGAVLIYDTGTTLASFIKGPGFDVNISAGTVQHTFAGILADDSVGSTGGWINILVPQPGDVVWCAVAAGTDAGDGVTIAASQAFADGGAFADEDMGVVLLDEDAADNPYGADNLAPVLFTLGYAA